MNYPALSLIQPWGWLVCPPLPRPLPKGLPKDIENRKWKRSHRGPVWIAASSTRNRAEYFAALAIAAEVLKPNDYEKIPGFDALPYGQIVGLVNFTDCVQSHNSHWFFGPNGFVLADNLTLREPVPCKGGLGLWKLPAGMEAQLARIGFIGMADFETAVHKLIGDEGGFAPKDNGNGAVKYGITSAFLKRIGMPCTPEFVRQLTPDVAQALYLEHFWTPCRLSEVRSQKIAENILYAAVNSGQDVGTKTLQRALNNFGQKVAVDGALGSRTIRAINTIEDTGVDQFCDAYDAHMLKHYERLDEEDHEMYGDDLAGWKKRLKAV